MLIVETIAKVRRAYFSSHAAPLPIKEGIGHVAESKSTQQSEIFRKLRSR
jgi:hypothetical protein